MRSQEEQPKARRQARSEKRANGQGSIYFVPTKSGKRSCKASIYDVNGKRRVKTFKKKADAEDWLADQRRAKHSGQQTYATNPKATVAEFMNQWLEDKYGHEVRVLLYSRAKNQIQVLNKKFCLVACT